MKATFAISATIDARDTAISNGRLLSDTPGPGTGKHTLTFATTKRMSPYLVALAVGDWECLSGQRRRHSDTRLRDARIAKTSLGSPSSRRSSRCAIFNQYFAIKYPFEKLDIVAVPDFSAGAMENTGAIVFREQFLARAGRAAARLNGGSRIAQFIAHNGASVIRRCTFTMALRSGSISGCKLGVCHLDENLRPMQECHPRTGTGSPEEVRDTQSAMALDALRASAGQSAPGSKRLIEIDQVFDAIAYQKTAAVIRMVEGLRRTCQLPGWHQRLREEVHLRKRDWQRASGQR